MGMATARLAKGSKLPLDAFASGRLLTGQKATQAAQTMIYPLGYHYYHAVASAHKYSPLFWWSFTGGWESAPNESQDRLAVASGAWQTFRFAHRAPTDRLQSFLFVSGSVFARDCMSPLSRRSSACALHGKLWHREKKKSRGSE